MMAPTQDCDSHSPPFPEGSRLRHLPEKDATGFWGRFVSRRFESATSRAAILGGLLLIGLMTPQAGQSALVVTVADNGTGGSVWSYTGSLSSAALGTPLGTGLTGTGNNNVSVSTPSFLNEVIVVPGNLTLYAPTLALTTPSLPVNTPWGTGFLGIPDSFVVTAADHFDFRPMQGFISVRTVDSNISGSMTFNTRTLNGLGGFGITPGTTFVYTYSTTVGMSTFQDTITFDFLSAAPAVPEPGAIIPLAVLSLFGGFFLWRRRRIAVDAIEVS